jgi:hypothetical protein
MRVKELAGIEPEVSMAQSTRVVSRLAVITVLAGACGGSGESRRAETETGAADTATMAGSAGGTVQPRVSNVMIGRQVGPGNRITEPSFQFGPRDTVHVSVATEGASGTLTAAWRNQSGEILQQSSAPVPPAGENAAFHLAQPKGLKAGTYKVIVFLDDDSVDTKVFVVKK